MAKVDLNLPDMEEMRILHEQACEALAQLSKPANQEYDFSKIKDVPVSTLKECETLEDLVEVATRFCKKEGC